VSRTCAAWLRTRTGTSERRLTRQFADFTTTFAGAADLIVEIRAATTWWTEIAAVDNIRITAGAVVATPPTLGKPTLSGSDINLTWTGGQAPFLVQWTPALP
jgi:hypothetical protein